MKKTWIVFAIILSCSLSHAQDFGGNFSGPQFIRAYEVWNDSTNFNYVLRASNYSVQNALDQLNQFSTNEIPSTSTTTCTPSLFRYNNNHLYVCTTSNTWRRVEISGWSGAANQFLLLEDNTSFLLEDGGKMTLEN